MTKLTTTIDYCYGLHNDGTPYFKFKEIITEIDEDMSDYTEQEIEESKIIWNEYHDLLVKITCLESEINRNEDDEKKCNILKDKKEELEEEYENFW